MLIGYVRVSKADGSQTVAPQRDALISAGVAPGDIYEDYASGKLDERPGLDACLRALRAGDTLIIWKLDRLGRSLQHLISVAADLNRREIGFRVLTGAPVDTTTPSGKLVFNIFASLAEFERELIRERTMSGLASARARGRFGGRPKKMTRAKLKLAATALANPSQNVGELVEQLGVSRQTLYRHLTPNGALRPEGEKLLGKLKSNGGQS